MMDAEDLLLRDFSDVFSDYIATDGTLQPGVTFLPIGGPLTWAADPDGLIMTAIVSALWGDCEQCLLTALFPMSLGAAAARCRQRRFPANEASAVTVKRRIDAVVGLSGERYSRFAVEVG